MRVQIFIPLAIFVAGFISYISALSVGFYSDDYGFTPLYILKPNEMLRAVYMAHLGLLNLHPFRPTAFFSFLIDYKIHGFEPAGYHLTNIIIHSCNAVLLYTLVREVVKNYWTPLIAALFFVLYPYDLDILNGLHRI